MFDDCTCTCNGCHSRTQKSVRYSFPKKLVVATSVVIVLAMCLTTVEARSIEHKIRHGRRHDPSTKDAKLRMPERQRQPGALNPAKDIANEYKLQIKTIQAKLKNTRRFLNQERRVISEWKEYRDGMPSWVPSTNFVTIHFNNYHRNGSNERWDAASMAERKFLFLMPRLYKSLQVFHNIFRRLIDVQVDAPDEAFVEYSKARNDLMRKTIGRVFSTVAAVKDSLIAYNVTIPRVDERNLQKMNTKVDTVQSLKNDYIAFRAYSNLLNNWYAEFKCPKGRKVTATNRMCIAYEAKLRKKKDQRTKSSSS